MRNAGRPLTRDVIMERVWGWESEPTSNSLEVFMGYLRRKTESERRAPADPYGPGRRLRDAERARDGPQASGAWAATRLDRPVA